MKIKPIGQLSPLTRRKLMIELTERFWKEHSHKEKTAKMQNKKKQVIFGA